MAGATATRWTGSYVSTVLLTLGQPLVWVYLFVAAFASDACPATADTGICDPDNQTLSLAVPFVVCSGAVVTAWLLVANAGPRRRAWGVLACWILSVAALRYSWILVQDVPAAAPVRIP